MASEEVGGFFRPAYSTLSVCRRGQPLPGQTSSCSAGPPRRFSEETCPFDGGCGDPPEPGSPRALKPKPWPQHARLRLKLVSVQRSATAVHSVPSLTYRPQEHPHSHRDDAAMTRGPGQIPAAPVQLLDPGAAPMRSRLRADGLHHAGLPLIDFISG